MKARYLSITPEILVSMLKAPWGQAFRCGKNRLPEDARLVGSISLFDHDPVEVQCNDGVPNRMEGRWIIRLWITSSAFLDTDPDELPPVQLSRLETK
jgi:hypothetical protein